MSCLKYVVLLIPNSHFKKQKKQKPHPFECVSQSVQSSEQDGPRAAPQVIGVIVVTGITFELIQMYSF